MKNAFDYPWLPIAETVEIGCAPFSVKALPKGVRVLENIGLAAVEALDGALLYRAVDELFEVRATITPGGDYLVMFPTGMHYGGSNEKRNTMMALRSSDKGETWSNPYIAFRTEINQHGFVPLIPRGSKRIYSFGTQPVWGLYSRTDGCTENAPVGWWVSDDDGFTWTGPTLINPVNDPGYLGMSVMRMCETNKGTWLLSAYHVYHPRTSKNPSDHHLTKQCILRSEDQGKTWTLLPGQREEGWRIMPYNRLDEGRPIQVGDRVLMLARTQEGHLWALWSDDDGKTWTDPQPTPLVHPDAPPMLALLSDGKTLVCLHHNRFHNVKNKVFDITKMEVMGDRSEIWASLSEDCGRTWSEPGFLYCNAAVHDLPIPFRNCQCSYNDLWADGGFLNIFVPHRWQQALHLKIKEKDLRNLPTRAQLTNNGEKP